MNKAVRPIEILLVEDSPTDVLMAREALEYSKILNELHVVEDGVEAVQFLKQEGDYAGKPRPDLILLDLNLPRMDGREVLMEIKKHEALRTIPVVILTTSSDEQDIMSAYKNYANCYVTKPVDFNAFTEVVKSIESFWFSVVTLPAGD